MMDEVQADVAAAGKNLENALGLEVVDTFFGLDEIIGLQEESNTRESDVVGQLNNSWRYNGL